MAYPYVVALIELEEGTRQIVTNIVGATPDAVRIGMPVELTFEEIPTEAWCCRSSHRRLTDERQRASSDPGLLGAQCGRRGDAPRRGGRR